MLSNAADEVRTVQGLVEESGVWVPATPEEKDKVRRQMNRLLQTAHFKNSKRYPALFRFIVEETLEGRGEFLKERLIGIRVFDRPADYDTASDPIVRVTIAEIRKRIAQYYHEEAHETEMRIELSPGHYEPEFRHRRDPSVDRTRSSADETLEAGEAAPPAAPEAAKPSATRGESRWLTFFLSVLAAIVIAVSCRFAWQWTHPSALEEFWAPLIATHKPIVFCLPAGIPNSGAAIARNAGILAPEDQSSSTSTAPGASVTAPASSSFLDHESAGENVVFSDMLATLEIAKWLARDGEESRARLTTTTTLDDLREGPSILVGGLDNPWTLRAIASLPYRFAGTDKEQYWIRDSKNPEKKDWGLDIETKYAAVNHDYALIARVHDQSTGQLVVVVAGIGMSGTAAAGEFLVDPEQMKELRRRLGPAFSTRDFEVVLSTDVVNGIAGAPKILAVTLL
jgi:hypothetical protein